jgi:hypothetical protein
MEELTGGGWYCGGVGALSNKTGTGTEGGGGVGIFLMGNGFKLVCL